VLDALIHGRTGIFEPDVWLGAVVGCGWNSFCHGAAPGLPDAFIKAIDGAIGPAVGSCGTAAFSKQPVYVSDIATNPLWVNYKDLALAHGLRACWSVPIFSSRGEVLGTFALYHPEPHQPNDNDLKVVEMATRTASIAIERQLSDGAVRESERRYSQLVNTCPRRFIRPTPRAASSFTMKRR
jgi:GAF domain-containing protein